MNDDFDDLPLTEFDEDLIEGAARDSASGEEDIAALPRILRYALLASRRDGSVHHRLLAEIEELCADLPCTPPWASMPDAEAGCRLAAELDHRAVVEDKSELRSLADCVRMLSLAFPRDKGLVEEHRRVARALLSSLRKAEQHAPTLLAAEVEAVIYGWAALPVCTDDVSKGFQTQALTLAAALGARMARHRIADVERKANARARSSVRKRIEADPVIATVNTSPKQDPPVPDGHTIVARIKPAQIADQKLKEISASLGMIINTAVPLVKTPVLSEVRRNLLFEFPYAGAVIDFALADLVGRPTVTLRPLLVVGPPGSGKTLFAGRLCHYLGVALWRTDCTRADGAAFGGTDRRWSSAQVCHPLLAIGRAGHANPAILLDELEKAALGRDYGRLFDCLLGFLEPETTARQFPDPALQTTLDLRHISYIATCNSVDTLPPPLQDRFRQIKFPNPEAKHLEALLPAVTADILRERGLDARWEAPVTREEKEAIVRYWHGGSVRRLRRVVEIVLRVRDKEMSRN